MRIRTVILLLCGALFLQAQRLPFRAYSTRDGLISNFVTSVAQDSKGTLWVGTDEGISQFDGERFRNIRFQDTLVVGYVNEIVESRHEPGVMWIGTNGGGLIRMENGRQTVFRLATEPKSNNINSIIEMEDGSFWCATDNGLYRVRDGAAIDHVRLDTLKIWIELTRSLDGTIWLCDEHRAAIFHPESKILEVPAIPGLPTDSILIVTALPDSTVAVHAFRKKHGVVYIVRNNTVLRTIETIFPAPIYTILRREGEYWIGSSSGIELYRTGPGAPTQWLYTTANGLTVNHMAFGVQDRDQNIWFGSFGSGLSKFAAQQSLQFSIPGMSPVVCTDESLHVWVPSNHGIYEVWKDSSDQWKRYLHILKGPAQDAAMVATTMQRGQHLWMTDVEGNIYRSDVKRNLRDHSEIAPPRPFVPNEPVPPLMSITLFIDSRGTLWSCIRDGGLIGFDATAEPRVVARWDFHRNTNLRDVRAMYEDRQGRIWIMGYDGENRILRWNSGAYVLDSTDAVLQQLPPVPYRAVLQTRDGTLWFGSRYHGLYIYRDGNLKHLTTKDGMISNQIWSMAETPDGGILIGSQAGLMLMPNQNVDRFMSLQDYSSSSVGTVIARDGLMVASSAFELTLFSLPDPRTLTAVPDVRFTSLFVNGKEEPLARSTTLSAGENTLTIDYTAISFRNTSALKFQYRLEPLEKNWSAPTNGRTVTYANLPSGDYRFLIRAFSPEGLPGDLPSVLPITIATPLWMRWWFLTGLSMIIVGVVAMAERFRVRRLLEIEKIRSRIAADLHDDIGSGLTRIALLSDMIRRQSDTGRESPDPQFSVGSLTGKVGAISRELVDAMSDVVWSIDPKNSTMEKLVHRVRTFATEVCEAKEITLRFTAPDHPERIPLGSDTLRALLLIAKEALTNIVRHSGARTAEVSITAQGKEFAIVVRDDGRGFDPTSLSRMNGLTNMRLRTEKNGGTFSIETAPERGTAIRAFLPVH